MRGRKVSLPPFLEHKSERFKDPWNREHDGVEWCICLLLLGTQVLNLLKTK